MLVMNFMLLTEFKLDNGAIKKTVGVVYWQGRADKCIARLKLTFHHVNLSIRNSLHKVNESSPWRSLAKCNFFSCSCCD